MTKQSKPEAATHWSTRKTAAALGISPASVSRHRRANGLKPHAVRGFELARDAKLVEKIEDIVGLYMSPATHALVLCCDDTGQLRALGRTQLESPLKKGRAVTKTHDYLRLGTTTLFAALKALDGRVIAECEEECRHIEWLKFLRQIDRETPKGKTLQVIADNHAADKHPAVRKWLVRNERFNIHITPASAPWLHGVERFFSQLDDKQLGSSVFIRVPELIATIEEHIARPTASPGPFIWAGSARDVRQEAILAKSPLSAQTNAAPRTSKARLKSTDKARARSSGEGNTLRENVITLKRDRILQEAATLFFERGYLQTSVDAIAERLGATKPFVYYHFNSKVDILVEICEHSVRDALAAVDNAMSAQGGPRVRFEQFVREFTDVALKQHQHVAIYFREEISLPKESADRINQMRKSINLRLTSLLSEGINTGDFQIEDPRMGALVIAGMSSYAFAWYRESGRLDQQEVTNRIVKMALKLVSASPFHRPAYRIHSVTGA